jgi:hypothetical protein
MKYCSNSFQYPLTNDICDTFGFFNLKVHKELKTYKVHLFNNQQEKKAGLALAGNCPIQICTMYYLVIFYLYT